MVIEKKLIELLSDNIARTTVQIVEEFKVEYPEFWQKIINEGRKLFGHSCTFVQSPQIIVANILSNLKDRGMINCYIYKNNKYWCIAEFH